MSERSDDDQDEDEDEDEGPVDEYDAEYFGDAKDRAELMAMAEVDREQILFERAKKVTNTTTTTTPDRYSALFLLFLFQKLLNAVHLSPPLLSLQMPFVLLAHSPFGS